MSGHQALQCVRVVGRVRIVRLVMLPALLGLLLAACGSIGATTTRIDAAEAEVDALLAELVATLDLDVLGEQPFGRRAACEQPGLGPGFSNTRSLRATLPAAEASVATQQAAAVLTAAGYTVTDADRGDGVFARRDGIRITLLLDPTRATTELDANTGCRAAPAG